MTILIGQCPDSGLVVDVVRGGTVAFGVVDVAWATCPPTQAAKETVTRVMATAALRSCDERCMCHATSYYTLEDPFGCLPIYSRFHSQSTRESAADLRMTLASRVQSEPMSLPREIGDGSSTGPGSMVMAHNSTMRSARMDRWCDRDPRLCALWSPRQRWTPPQSGTARIGRHLTFHSLHSFGQVKESDT